MRKSLPLLVTIIAFGLVSGCAPEPVGSKSPSASEATGDVDYNASGHFETDNKDTSRFTTPCGAPVTDSSGRPLAVGSTYVISNGLCTGYGRSCGRTYNSPPACHRNSQATRVRDYDSSAATNKWQCVELVKRHFRDAYGIDPNSYRGNAHELFGGRIPNTVSHRNGSPANPPIVGDALVWGATESNSYGHIALVAEVSRRSVSVIHQNVPINRPTTHEWDARTGTLGGGGMRGNLLGWVHATANTGAGAGGSTGDDSPDEGVSTGRPCGGFGGDWQCDTHYRDLHRCEGGSLVTVSCGSGCETDRSGDRCAGETTPDAPMMGTITCDQLDGNGRYFTCLDGDLYKCEDGRVVIAECPAGCRARFWNDRCLEVDNGGGSTTANICDNTCEYASDGECDDGGPRSEYSACAFGTDCADCGAREEADRPEAPADEPPRAIPLEEVCSDSCEYPADGECDDGGEGSINSLCGLGTDCSDCGIRYR